MLKDGLDRVCEGKISLVNVGPSGLHENVALTDALLYVMRLIIIYERMRLPRLHLKIDNLKMKECDVDKLGSD